MKKFIKLVALVISVFLFVGCETQDEKKRIEYKPNVDEKIEFSTVDIDGNAVTTDIIKDAKVVMINYWEPWCGPCVREMPDIEKLYEEYKEQGLLVLGVFSTKDMADDVKTILKNCNISYPVIYADSNLERHMTNYVPTTIFIDSEGNIISSEPIVGAHDYSDWEGIIKDYL